MICFESSYVAYQIYGMCYYSEGKVWETRGADEPAGRGGQGFAQAAPAWKKWTEEKMKRRREGDDYSEQGEEAGNKAPKRSKI